MNLRFWGGWFLVLAFVGVILTMGCEKGALGVKPAVVMGKVVDSSNVAIPVVNAQVTMVSKETSGDNDLAQGNNFVSTRTDADGNFIFENVQPDNVIFEIEASGYSKKMYPSTTAEASEEGETAAVSQFDSIYVRSGSVTNVGNLGMTKISSPLPETITASIVLRDAKTLEVLGENAGPVTISFNNQTLTLPVSNWKSGTDLTGNPITLTAESSFNVMVKASPDLYLAKTETLSGAGDIQAEILLTPVSYNLLLRCTNVPDYIEGGVVNIFAETIPANLASPPKVIATHTIDNLGDLSAPNLPETISVPGLALPVNLRVQVRGYQDEVIQISSNNLPAGSQGTYRVDINFLLNNAASNLIYDPVTASQAGLLDNRVTRDLSLVVAGPGLLSTDAVSGAISLPSDAPVYHNGAIQSNLCQNNQPVRITFPNTVVGYDFTYSVTVSPTQPASPSYASGSYSISSPQAMMLPVPDDIPVSGIIVGVDARRPE